MFVLVRLRRVPVAIVRRRFRFRRRAAARFLAHRNDWFPRDHREGDGAGEEQAEQKSQHGSHDDSLYHLVGAGFNPRLEVGPRNARFLAEAGRITFACDLSGDYNPYPMVRPVMRQMKICP